jgi:glutaredoxin 3
MDDKKKITIYSLPAWPHCKRAVKFLEEAGVSFQDINVGSDRTAREKMIRKSNQMSVPVIDIDGDIIIGFNEAKLKAKLSI